MGEREDRGPWCTKGRERGSSKERAGGRGAAAKEERGENMGDRGDFVPKGERDARGLARGSEMFREGIEDKEGCKQDGIVVQSNNSKSIISSMSSAVAVQNFVVLF